jgi:hypothetical protein
MAAIIRSLVSISVPIMSSFSTSWEKLGVRREEVVYVTNLNISDDLLSRLFHIGQTFLDSFIGLKTIMFGIDELRKPFNVIP